MSYFRLLLLISLLFAPGWSRPIHADDLYRMVWIGDFQLSPDGTQACVTLVECNENRSDYRSHLVLLAPGHLPVPLTSGPADRWPRWSPDGKGLAYVEGQSGGLRGVDVTGNELWRVERDPLAGPPSWSSDGQILLWSGPTLRATPEQAPKARVITRAHYRADGQGYLQPERVSHIWYWDQDSPPRRLAEGHSPQISRDGKQVVFVRPDSEEPFHRAPRQHVWRTDLSSGVSRCLKTLERDLWSPALSPDGRRLAFHSSEPEPVRSYSKPDLYVLELESGQVSNLSAESPFGLGEGVLSDCGAPRAGGGVGPQWSPDGGSILALGAQRGQVHLLRFGLDGSIKPLTQGPQAILGFSQSHEGKILVKRGSATQINQLLDPLLKCWM